MENSNSTQQQQQKQKKKNFRKRNIEEVEDEEAKSKVSDDEEERRLALEEVGGNGGGLTKIAEKNEVDGEKDELVLQDTFAQETAVMVEDPNMVNYIEQELAKRRGKNVDVTDQVENDLKRAEDELYKVPEHLKVKKRNSEESSTQWTTGIAEVQLPIEYKLKNIEETEAAKKLLQEKRLMGRSKSNLAFPQVTVQIISNAAGITLRNLEEVADYIIYSEFLTVYEKLAEHPELYKDRGSQDDGAGARPTDNGADAAGSRQAATDEFMLERFRKRERHRVMRR
ncbi:hypothetical protein Patl1_00750 [Pistacia atlantica]|uniref:Uncharacterized protein n=1 Tax=Pistacia atlantica TaxID=434234 RepID=A0ACC1C6I4_9ROSI|nr:hypothetical protein Patl1_00750 [Pistacia atlantica]